MPTMQLLLARLLLLHRGSDSQVIVSVVHDYKLQTCLLRVPQLRLGTYRFHSSWSVSQRNRSSYGPQRIFLSDYLFIHYCQNRV